MSMLLTDYTYRRGLLKGRPTSRRLQFVSSSSDDPPSPASDPPQQRPLDVFRFAFLNVTLLAFAVGCVFAVSAGYFLFYDFVKPLIWAVICGIVLYPLKRQMTLTVKNWFENLADTGRPLGVGIACLPFTILDAVGNSLLSIISSNKGAVLCLGVSMPFISFALKNQFIPSGLMLASKLLRLINQIVDLSGSFWVPVVFANFKAYQLSFELHFASSGPRPPAFVSVFFWLTFVGFCCSYCGPLKTPAFMIFLLIATFRWLTRERQEMSMERAKQQIEVVRENWNRRKSVQIEKLESSCTTFIEKAKRQMADIFSDQDNIDRSLSTDSFFESNNESDFYLRWLILACFFVYASLHVGLLYVLLLPLTYGVVKKILEHFKILENLHEKFEAALEGVEAGVSVVPAWVRDVIQTLLTFDRQVIQYLESSMDAVGSIASIFLLAVGILAIVLLMLSQLYYESVHMINLTTEIAEKQFMTNLVFQKFIRDTFNVSSVTDALKQTVGTAYLYANSWIFDRVDDLVKDEEKGAAMKTQAVFVLNALFQSLLPSLQTEDAPWKSTETTISTAYQLEQSGAALEDSFEAFDDDLASWLPLRFVRKNIFFVYSFVESSRLLLASNFEIVVAYLSDIVSTALASGTALIDFWLDAIVFLTMLFLLLSSSDQQFKALEILEHISPDKERADEISKMIEQTVSGVFIASLKMGIFYGFYTWLTHTLFAVNLVFIPSVLSGLLAAVPFVGPYVVTVPAILELWIVRGEPILAGFLLVLQMLPSYFVDDAIYSEIKTTHPLLTGMSIAGGMLWWGLEGVVFGPVILCIILVMFSVYRSIIAKQEQTTE